MLTESKMVGFVVTRDYERARAFCEKKLGFQFVSLDPYALVMTDQENNLVESGSGNSKSVVLRRTQSVEL